MKQFVLIIAGIYGTLSVVLGAFGAHVFEKVLPVDKLASCFLSAFISWCFQNIGM